MVAKQTCNTSHLVILASEEAEDLRLVDRIQFHLAPTSERELSNAENYETSSEK